MTKHYCDHCGGEISKLPPYSATHKGNSIEVTLSVRGADYCLSCATYLLQQANLPPLAKKASMAE